MAKPTRETVDLSAYPDLVVIYLGIRVQSLRGLRTIAALGPRIQASVDAKPEGQLLHEWLLYGLLPPHVGMRQYWRDFDALEAWSRSGEHAGWWRDYLRDRGGTGFWHETYFARGAEAVYVDVATRPGFSSFAPTHPAKGTRFGARQRHGLGGTPSHDAPVPEAELG